jgi:hypothetical protein
MRDHVTVMLPWRRYTMAHMGVWVPWRLRMWAGLTTLLDGVVCVGTLGLVTSGFASDAWFAILDEGLRREAQDG